MDTLAENPEAAAIAARFGVPEFLHSQDFMYIYHLGPFPEVWPQVQGGAAEYYFKDGAHSAQQLQDLVAHNHPDFKTRPLQLLEFASGYGMVSRHLAQKTDIFKLTSCDIHEDATVFLKNKIGVEAILSRSHPDDLVLPAKYDVIFVLSLFSHLPDRTFGPWLRKLTSALDMNGLLIFTTHGRGGYDRAGRPPLSSDGFCFISGSEQKDIPADDYGTMLISPSYAFRQIESCLDVDIISFQGSSWWGDSDTFILRKVPVPYQQTTLSSVAGAPSADADRGPEDAPINLPPKASWKAFLAYLLKARQ